MTKYYSYIRVSTESQVESGYGLDTQQQNINEYAKRNSIEISGYYSDKGVSGTIYDRPGLSDLLSVLESSDKIIVWETSRLWREEFVRVTLLHTLKKIGCDIISVSQPSYSLYTESASDWLLNSILGVLDEYDKILTVRKLQAGRKTKARSGQKACGSAPIGYKWNNNAEIEIDDDGMIIVTDIFRSYIELRSFGKVAEYCKSKGYKTVHGNDFSKQSISNILHNKFYHGVVTHSGQEYPGTQPTFITQEIFDTVQNLMEDK